MMDALLRGTGYISLRGPGRLVPILEETRRRNATRTERSLRAVGDAIRHSMNEFEAKGK